MLLRAPVQALKSGRVQRRAGHIVIAMRHYPRYTPKELSDEYVQALAPDATLFDEFKATERAVRDHDQAFDDVRYEARFALSPKGLEELARLAELARRKDVYLICQCDHEQKCHTDLVLMTARARFDAPIGMLPHAYPTYAERLKAP
jgi:uncharacterized protein YeaO (DUF488 family)